MATVSVSIIDQRSGSLRIANVTLLQFEDENRRVYLQPADGEPLRIDLVAGDSVIVTVEG